MSSGGIGSSPGSSVSTIVVPAAIAIARPKFPLSTAEADITPSVCARRPNDREIRGNRMLEDALLTTVFPHFLVLAEVSAGTGRREEGRNAGTAGPDAFGECALWNHFYFKIAV